MHNIIDLCGEWELSYTEHIPNPLSTLHVPENTYTTNAVPGYWEDMLPSLQMAPYWNLIKFNPDFRPLRYPMTGTVPDMVLQTIIGCFFYRKCVFIGTENKGKSVFFNCGGVQNRMLLWINGMLVGEHLGYSTPFSFDITEYIAFNTKNEIIFLISNHDLYNEDGDVISGCTNRAANRFTGGVTGAINIEFRNKAHISDMYISSYIPETDSFTVYSSLSNCENYSLSWEIYDNDMLIRNGTSEFSEFSIPRDNLAFWSPKTPKLYRLVLILISNGVLTDTSELEIGIRQLCTDGCRLHLNGSPVYLRGICEHGYFPKTVHPDADAGYYKNIIQTLKQMDFNFIRFHTWIPTEEYMTMADRLGILLHVESPNNTTEAEWANIMKYVRRHPSVVIACCGNELLIDERKLQHLEHCAAITHSLAPGLLFSPMSALRGVEYYWQPSNLGNDIKQEPFEHNPVRLAKLQEFSDVFSSYALGQLSYESTNCNTEQLDSFADIYKIPRLSHEICIHGTYADLGLEWRYADSRIGESEVYFSVRKILNQAGLLHRAPLYYKNSCKWQQLLRKHCFESARLTGTLAGYDFLGDIDHHWHTFGYRAGMMNEFYELKPGETIENIRRYNGESVLLSDLGVKRCFTEADMIRIHFLISLFGGKDLKNAKLNVRFETSDRSILSRYSFDVSAPNGKLSPLALLEVSAPEIDKPCCIRIYARISDDIYELENEWDIWIFPKTVSINIGKIICTDTINTEILSKLDSGSDVLLLGTGQFQKNPMSFRISLAGRTAGNLATVIENHPLTDTFEHDGFCSWPFFNMMNDASCVYFSPKTKVPFDPIIEVESSYKWIRKQAAVVEFKVGNGRLLISTFNLSSNGPAEKWWLSNLLHYMSGEAFEPRTSVTPTELCTLFSDGSLADEINTNLAANINDITMKN